MSSRIKASSVRTETLCGDYGTKVAFDPHYQYTYGLRKHYLSILLSGEFPARRIRKIPDIIQSTRYNTAFIEIVWGKLTAKDLERIEKVNEAL